MSKTSKFLQPLATQVASGQSIKDSAATVGCSCRTAYNLSSTSEFKTRVSEIRSEVSAGTVGILTLAASEAAATLRALLSTTQEPNTRLNAAKAILANLGPMAELGELRRRIDELERRQ